MSRKTAKTAMAKLIQDRPGFSLRVLCIVMSFWTGWQRLIASLESELRLGLAARLWLTRLSPYRCLAGRPPSVLPREIKTESFVLGRKNGTGNFSGLIPFYLLTYRA